MKKTHKTGAKARGLQCQPFKFTNVRLRLTFCANRRGDSQLFIANAAEGLIPIVEVGLVLVLESGFDELCT
jgi:hypothetical protein